MTTYLPTKPYLDAWPYPDMEEFYERRSNEWRETILETYDNQLGCVPPVRMNGGFFMVGEQFTADVGGCVYAVFGEVQGRYFGRLSHLQNFDPDRYVTEINAQFFSKESDHG